MAIKKKKRKKTNPKKQVQIDTFGSKILGRKTVHMPQKFSFKHDEAYRGILKHPELLLDFLKTIQLPNIPLEDLSIEDISSRDTSLLGKEHGQERSDLFFRLSIKDKKTDKVEHSYLFLCIEHQSTNDPKMPVRVTSYVSGQMVSIIADQDNNFKSSRGLPLIWPIVLFTDCGSKWTAPLDMLSCMDQEQLQRFPMLKKFYTDAPVYDLVSIQDLNHTSLEQMDTLFSMIVLLETSKNTSKYNEVQERLICRIADMRKTNPSLARFVEEWYYYFEAKQLSQTKAAIGEEILVVEAKQLSADELSQYVTKSVKTTYQMFQEEAFEQGIEQGIEKGIEQGIEKGIEQGIEKGIEQGIEKGVQLDRQVMLEGLFAEYYGQEGSVYWQKYFAHQTISNETYKRLLEHIFSRLPLSELMPH